MRNEDDGLRPATTGISLEFLGLGADSLGMYTLRDTGYVQSESWKYRIYMGKY